tara:strand:- start:2106 stop:3278 length:1173 start_codon:yes stop_codon:yes gene_type:complete
MQQFDFVIHGAGMIGSATAVGLAQLGFSVALIEAKPPQPFDALQPFDMRVSALSFASELMLERLGAWSWIRKQRIRTYKHLEAFERPDQVLRFSAPDAGLPYLGHFVENRLVQLGLWHQFEHYDQIKLWSGQSIREMTWQPEQVVIELEDGETLAAKWVIGADGMHSLIRQKASIAVSGKGYDQAALVVSVRTQYPEQQTTWQQFTPEGARAYLPLADDSASLVWYAKPDQVQQLKSLPDAVLRREIMHAFPERLGDISIQNRAFFGLTRQHARQYVAPRTLLIGDAAHSIHPLAGQGVNLGFKDLKVLLDVITQAQNKGQQVFSEASFKPYHQLRYRDNLLMMSTMDVFYQGFKVNLPWVRKLRQFSLKCAAKSGPIKHHLLKYAVGLT